MIKRIYNFILKDMTNALRNNMIIYVILFPILLAVLMNLLIPSVEQMKLTIAVDSRAEEWVIERLKDYGKVELFDSQEQIRERVLELDDVSGIIRDGEEYVVLFEGNETGEAEEIATALMNSVLSDKTKAEFKHISLNKDNSAMKETSGSILVLTAIIVAGLIIGFNIIDEKESKVIKALAVSPLRLFEFIISHSLLSIVIALILGLISSYTLFGPMIDYWKLIIAIICTVGVGIAWGFTIGGIADNLISAIAILKSGMLVMIGIPIGSLFMPDNFHWVFYPFPNYWAFQCYQNVFSKGELMYGFTQSCLITVLFSLIIICGLTPMLKKRVKLD